MNDIQELTAHSDPIIAKTASRALRISEMLDTGAITKNQHDELLKNLLQLKDIEDSIQDLERKQTIVAAFQTIITTLGIISLF